MELSPEFNSPYIPVQKIEDPLLEGLGTSLSILRTDLIHPVVSGNKWFKLKYNLIKAHEQGKRSLLSFGGPWSNHLHALAEAGRLFDFKTIGLVRGELATPLNSCLDDARKAGMLLEGISRSIYREKDNPDYLRSLQQRFPDAYLIPEGGANREGVQGCAELNLYFDENQFDLVCMACGTGTMLTGLATTSAIPLLGFQILKGDNYLNRQISNNLQKFGLSSHCEWSINDTFHFGGYAKTTEELIAFISRFERVNKIPLEPVYSGKMLYGLYELTKKRDFFPQNSRIMIIHGGGLQGKRGFL